MTNALILKNESLNKYNSWRVGGTADTLFTPQNLEDLKNFLKHYIKEKDEAELLQLVEEFCACLRSMKLTSF